MVSIRGEPHVKREVLCGRRAPTITTPSDTNQMPLDDCRLQTTGWTALRSYLQVRRRTVIVMINVARNILFRDRRYPVSCFRCNTHPPSDNYFF